MEPILIGISGIGVMLFLLFWGVPVAVSMGITAFLGYGVLRGWGPSLALAGSVLFDKAKSYELAVIGLFILMGSFILHSGIASRLFDTLNRWLSWIRGGMVVATTMSCAVFGACCGSSLATAATFSRIAVPELLRYGHHPEIATAAVAAAGTQAVLIPPSALMVIYAILCELPVGKCLVAGFLPGALSAFLYMVTVLAVVRLRPYLAPKVAKTFSWAERLRTLPNVLPLILIGAFILCALFFGWAGVTEVGGVGAFACLMTALIVAGPRKAHLEEASRHAGRQTAMILFIIIAAVWYSRFIAISGLPTAVVDWVAASNIPPYGVLAVVLLMYVVLGMVMDVIGMLVITLPLVFPLITKLGFDPIWFGVIVIKMSEIAAITPPVGLNVYVTKVGVGNMATIGEIFKGCLYFLVADIATLLILIAVPQISLLLPQYMAY